jgi:ribonuclease HI
VKRVVIHTDGACSGNPGPGGWAAILVWNGTEKEISGGEPETTNNRMELTAAIEALRRLKEPCEALVRSDSAYLVKAFNEGWIRTWQAEGWREGKRNEVKNADLWRTLIELAGRHSIRWELVKGHSDDEWNERCDRLAVAASRAVRERGGGRT